MVELALHSFHQSAGAAFGSLAEHELVSHYADWRAEYQALRKTAGVLDLSFRGRLCVLGADRQRFLHGQVTNHVNELRPGRGCYAALVTAKGKLESDLNLYCLEEEILLDFEPGLTARLTERLEKFVIAEDVQMADVSELYQLLSVQGPKAADILSRLAIPPPVPEAVRSLVKADGEIYVARTPRLGSDGFDIFVPREASRIVAGQLAAAACLCGWQAFETARIEAGIPRFGVDMDESNLAPEALDAGAISYAKGCYIGQEVIARIRTYGKVAKSLHRLKLAADAGEPPLKGTKIYLAEKEVGYITSATRSPTLGVIVCLGYVRREALKSGAELTVETSSGRVAVQIQESHS